MGGVYRTYKCPVGSNSKRSSRRGNTSAICTYWPLLWNVSNSFYRPISRHLWYSPRFKSAKKAQRRPLCRCRNRLLSRLRSRLSASALLPQRQGQRSVFHARTEWLKPELVASLLRATLPPLHRVGPRLCPRARWKHYARPLPKTRSPNNSASTFTCDSEK